MTLNEGLKGGEEVGRQMLKKNIPGRKTSQCKDGESKVDEQQQRMVSEGVQEVQAVEGLTSHYIPLDFTLSVMGSHGRAWTSHFYKSTLPAGL